MQFHIEELQPDATSTVKLESTSEQWNEGQVKCLSIVLFSSIVIVAAKSAGAVIKSG